MAIKFTCPHPGCDKVLQVPDEMAGMKDRCPRCGRPLTVPEAAGEFGEKDEAYIRAITAPRAEPGTPEALPQDARATRHCPSCGRLMGLEADVCPFCGHAISEQAATPAPPRETAPGPKAAHFVPARGDYLGSCRRCGGVVLKAVPHLLPPALLAGVLYAVLRLWTGAAGLPADGDYWRLALAAAGALTLVAAVGCLGRLCIAVVSAVLADSTDAARPPTANPVAMLSAGAKLVGLLAVYAGPVVTLPLLPVGLVGLAYAADARAYDVLWAGRAAGRCAEDLALLWLMLLAILAVTVLAGAGIMVPFHALAEASAAGLEPPWETVTQVLVSSAGAALAAGIALAGVTAVCCFVGLLGRHNPEVVRSLRGRRTRRRGAAFLIAGLCVSTAVAVAVVVFARGAG
jgi:hypothetical protein